MTEHETNNVSSSSPTITPLNERKEKDTVPPLSTKEESTVTKDEKPRRRRIIRRRRPTQSAEDAPYEIDSALLSKVLKESNLPKAYTFEIVKSVQRIVKERARIIALQMPEGLLLYATVLADVFEQLAPCLQEVCVLGDVTYGACCVDDLTAKGLRCELLIHYGHSCLVPLQHTVVPVLYVFVEIHIDVLHCMQTVLATFNTQLLSKGGDEEERLKTFQETTHIYLLGTVQFRHALEPAKEMLQNQYGYKNVSIPQVKPLSPGEVLGCTSPKLPQHEPEDRSVVIFIADGRFHLESTLISNPHITVFYRYDPYGRVLTEEAYDYNAMYTLRSQAIKAAKRAQTFGLILGTLGRQGNPAILQRLRDVLKRNNKSCFIMLLSEITPKKLLLFTSHVDCWVQVACPRLSVDWGHLLSSQNIPVLSPYELFCVFESSTTEATKNSEIVNSATNWQNDIVTSETTASNESSSDAAKKMSSYYPMDYYSQTGGPWSNYYKENKDRKM